MYASVYVDILILLDFAVYSPEPNYLVPQLRKLPMFNDPEYNMTGYNLPKEFEESDKPLVMP